ncbi:minor capsid protein [Human papillomavirus 139]|uniref:Minor capsid protein L2 n=1 Tax=Human papillomavirus 139 TaxID=1070412 RepID=I6MRE6_9PAPI|nr:minor capsid protein [Human papillomavirus 139]
MASDIPRKRTKRDSVTNLYNTCRISGNCPDDVKNKVEANTLADKLLRILSSIVYFGGLGIGTGKGTGGATGYRPLGGGSGGRVTTDGTVIRPSIVVEPVGPSDLVPIDALSPGSSSIVPLQEAGPEIVVPDIGSGINAGELEVITEPDVIDITGPRETPTVTTGDDNAAVIDVQPGPSTPRRVATSTSRFANPSFLSIVTSSSPTEAGATLIDVFVNASDGGNFVGEEIPLDTFNEPQEFEIEEPPQPRSSTPLAFSRAYSRARDLYNRRVRQVMTQNINFLTRAPQAVQFSFENPAFDPDVTLEFQQDVNQLAAAAPDLDFADIVRLQRPRFSETAEGNIRVSRLGTKGTIRLRSGTQIGETVHFYYDLSSIENAEAIELSVLGEHSGEASVVNPLAESSFVDAENSSAPLLFPEEELLDNITEDFSNSHIVLSAGSRRSTLTVPTLPPGVALRVFIDDVGEGLFVSHPVSIDTIPEGVIPMADVTPSILIDEFSSDDFILHPSHIRRRKRKRLNSL